MNISFIWFATLTAMLLTIWWGEGALCVVQALGDTNLSCGRIPSAITPQPRRESQISNSQIKNPMIPRYTRPEMGRIWSDQNKFQKWLEVEIATAEVEAEAGLIPKSRRARHPPEGAI